MMEPPTLLSRAAVLVLAFVCTLCSLSVARGQSSTAFSYQGYLEDGNQPATGSVDLRVELFDSEVSGAPIGSPVVKEDVALDDGVFMVTLDFGAVFDQGTHFLQIGVRDASSTNSFTTLSPREALRPAPLAQVAQTALSLPGVTLEGGNVGIGAAPGSPLTVAGLIESTSGGLKLPDGTVLDEAGDLGGGGAANAWSLGGNSGTDPASDFLGTIDDVPVELRINAVRALRLEPATAPDGTVVPNVIGGDSANHVAANVYGATIGGGGFDDGPGGVADAPNAVEANFGTIGGGKDNTAGGVGGTIGGGLFNRAGFRATVGGGFGNSATDQSTVGGGSTNTASGIRSTVGGGLSNIANGLSATVSGGGSNIAKGDYSLVPGGEANEARADYGFAAGYKARVKPSHHGSFVWADASTSARGNSTLDSLLTTGANQFLIRATGGVGIGTNSPTSPLTVNGTIESTTGGLKLPDGTVLDEAGDLDAAASAWTLGGNAGTDPVTDFLGTTDETALELRVNGSRGLRLEPATDPDGNVVPNVIAGDPANSVTVGTYGATIGGGINNAASDDWATVAGGSFNTASGLDATVGGGGGNTASGEYATVPGGQGTEAQGDYSFAAGFFARAKHNGSFVWSDNSQIAGKSLLSTGPHQFLVRAAGGVGIGTNEPTAQFHVQDNIDGSAQLFGSHVALLDNENTASGPDVLALRVGTTGDPGANVNFMTFFDGDKDIVGQVEGNGSGGVSYKTSGADFAEMLPRLRPTEAMEPGDLVGVVGGKVTRRTDTAPTLMVVSDQAALVGNTPRQDATGGYEQVAFVGQVPVKVRGPAKVGDYVVASGRHDGTGVAVAPDAWSPTEHGPIAGRVWEAKTSNRIQRVNVLVGVTRLGTVVNRLRRQQQHIDALETRLRRIEQTLHASPSTSSR